MTLAFKASALFAGALSMSMFLACGDKEVDDTGAGDGGTDSDGGTETEGETDCDDGIDNDGDGRIDCDDSDCRDAPECQVFEPTVFTFEASTGMMEGVLASANVAGDPLGNYFTILMFNEDWEGADDESNHCRIFFDVLGAEVDGSCADCWAGASWVVDTSMVAGTSGECDKLDPDVWSDDPVTYLSEVDFSFGFGTVGSSGSDFQDSIETAFGSYWEQYSENVFVFNIYTNLAGEAAWYNWGYTIAYEIDSSGAIVGDGSVPLTVGESAFAPDGYYLAYFLYGFNLQ